MPQSNSPKNGRSSSMLQRPSIFNETTPLYFILTSLPDYDHGIRDVRFIDEYSCMACLFYLNVALYDYYLSARNFDNYLQWVNWELRKFNPHAAPSIASLLWILMSNGGFPSSDTSDKGERSWFVSRMLRVAKKLEWTKGGALWDDLRRTLVELLITQQQCGIYSDFIGESELLARKKRLSHPWHLPWDEDAMRRDILGPYYAGSPHFNMPPSSEAHQYYYDTTRCTDSTPATLGS